MIWISASVSWLVSGKLEGKDGRTPLSCINIDSKKPFSRLALSRSEYSKLPRESDKGATPEGELNFLFTNL